METISESRWREIKQANQQVSVVGRSLLLGVITGFLSGAGMGLALAFPDWTDAGGGLVLGGIFGMIVGLGFAGVLAPFVLWRARQTQGCPRARERLSFACLPTLPVVLTWRLFVGTVNWPAEFPAMAAATGIAAVCTALFLGWCMRPFDHGGPQSAPNRECEEVSKLDRPVWSSRRKP